MYLVILVPAVVQIAGLLSETDKLEAFFKTAKRRGLCYSDFFVSHLIDRADSKLSKLIQVSHIIVSTPFFLVLTFQTPAILLDPEDTRVLFAPVKHSYV